MTVQRDFEAMARGATAQILQAAVDDGALVLPLSAERVADAFIAQVEAIVLPLGERSPADHHALVGLFAHMFFTSYARDSTLVDGLARKLKTGHTC